METVTRRNLLTFWRRDLCPVEVFPARCFSVAGQPCDYCVTACETGAVWLDDTGRPRVDGSRCDGCGQCEFLCPAPTPAIRVIAGID